MTPPQANLTRSTKTWTKWLPALWVRENRSLPSFFIVGPPRTGTSWLHEVLKANCALPQTKETRFFDVHFNRGTAWYIAHYPHVHCRRAGEVAPTYFASAEARSRIRELIPHAKIVCIFRDPIARLVSLYRLKRAYGWIPWSLEEALHCDPELTESSRYASHLKAWQQDFGSEHVLPTLFDDLCEDPQAFVNAITDFIDVPRFALTAADYRDIHVSDLMTIPRSYHGTHTARLILEWLQVMRFDRIAAAAKNSPLRRLFLGGGAAFPDLSADLSDKVFELVRREIEELEVILKRDLSAWKPLTATLRSA